MAPNKRINLANTLFLTLTPVLALVLGAWHLSTHGLSRPNGALFVAMYFAAGLSITAGYHRLFAHRAYEAHPVVQFVFLVLGAGAFQNSILRWGRDHRLHHQYVDRGEDPYNFTKGFWWAHIGWIFFKHETRDQDFSKVPDFLADKLIMWQHRWYVPLGAFSGFALPALIGWAYGDAFGGFIWGGLIRIVLVHHFTFSINSFAHWLGSQPYSETNTARDSWITALISYGEGYHNFHHAFAADYRNGIRWYQYDPTKWLINGLRWIGLVGRVTRMREEMIQKAMLETQHRRAERMISAAPSALRARLEPRIAGAKKRCEAALREWAAAKVQLAAMKRSMIRRRDETVKLWKLKAKTCHLEFQTAQLRWAFLMAALSRLDHASSFRHFLS